MKNIAGLLQKLKYTVIDGKPEGEISELVYDSRKVTKDCMFVCIKGAAYDSHDHTEEIARAGAKVIVAERPVKVPEGVTLYWWRTAVMRFPCCPQRILIIRRKS